ncbi:hypothetical protein SAMN05216567_112132 [Variovorax sp. OK605]|jgi:hypothetical protein|uniref:hypothetical protein n=1 Tax=unclassified Variovorax TaxID=663243 RepID=UPI0008CF6B68|nr:MULTISPECIES: hypothetical protein [unclassified Variovorax]SEK16803.1 hypothetical protein SAMN05518853_13061 [Variovorax sp. OK202]SFE59769.1 hypothetical protein SAMN05444746_12961 [Variovorax sp. OK212]SFQ22825.1 hypothetical protein SAMN05216567_112132 [Variovorax sp. OK605]
MQSTRNKQRKRWLCAAILTMACLHSAAADEESVRELAEASQVMLNDLASQVIDLRAMADRKAFDTVTKTLEKQAGQWPVETDATEKYRPCKHALERALQLARLTHAKATATKAAPPPDEKEWLGEHAKLTDRRAVCERVLRHPLVRAS